jgi:serine/threonine-protein kinase
MLGGRYLLVRPIARGGMADVWEGYDEVLSRPVATKLLQSHLAEDGIFLERFRREAVTAARLVHPGVVSTFDTGVDGGTAYIVMELVRGFTLRQLLNENGSLQPWLAVAITRQIADVLIYAHQAGLVHRDIKPANILLTDDEWGGLRVKVTDFGIAKATSGLGSDLTRTGIVLGTPKYLSPEQISGKEPDSRADLYSLGVVLFEMLAGAPPFVGNSDMTIALAHLNDRPPRVSSRAGGVPPALDRLVGDLLTKDPQQRVSSAFVVRQRLDELKLSPQPASLATGRRGVVPPAGSGGMNTPRQPDPADRSPSRTATPRSHAALTAVFAATGSAPALAGRSQRQGGGSDQYGGPGTEVLAPTATPPRSSRRRRGPGFVVLGLVVAGAAVAGVLLAGRDKGAPPGRPPTLPVLTQQITSVTPFMLRGAPDDPEGLPLVFDGNPTTAWHTDEYSTANFGNLYPGLGLDIHLTRTGTLHRLVVTSPTDGWAAQTYVSTVPISSGQPVSAWGKPTDSKTGISGSATFDLNGQRGQWVLLWLTHLGASGPPYQATVNEISLT